MYTRATASKLHAFSRLVREDSGHGTKTPQGRSRVEGSRKEAGEAIGKLGLHVTYLRRRNETGAWVWLLFLGFLNRLQSFPHFTDDL